MRKIEETEPEVPPFDFFFFFLNQWCCIVRDNPRMQLSSYGVLKTQKASAFTPDPTSPKAKQTPEPTSPKAKAPIMALTKETYHPLLYKRPRENSNVPKSKRQNLTEAKKCNRKQQAETSNQPTKHSMRLPSNPGSVRSEVGC